LPQNQSKPNHEHHALKPKNEPKTLVKLEETRHISFKRFLVKSNLI
jgi:hypothetical protein